MQPSILSSSDWSVKGKGDGSVQGKRQGNICPAGRQLCSRRSIAKHKQEKARVEVKLKSLHDVLMYRMSVQELYTHMMAGSAEDVD